MSHSIRRVSTLTVLFALLLGLTAAVGAPAALSAPPWQRTTTEASTPDVDAVRLSVRIRTNSDWTTVTLGPGEVVAAATTATSGGTVTREGGAWQVRADQPGTVADATIDLVFFDPDTRDLTLTVDKGWAGRTVVDVAEGSTGAAITTVDNRTQSSTDPNNRQAWTLASESIYTAPLELPQADARKLVLSFYYPWFDGSYDDPTLTDRPLAPRSTYRYTDVLSMTEQARDAGVSGFVVSWAGETANGYGFDLAVAAAEATGQVVTGYLEPSLSPDAATTFAWLKELLTRADSPSFLRGADGRPVVFVFAMEAHPAWVWMTMRNQLAAAGTDVLLVGDTSDPAFAPASWGEHRYVASGTTEERAAEGRRIAVTLRARHLVEGAELGPWVANVSPGYDDHLVRDGSIIVDREGGQRYLDTWDAAIASTADWIVVQSWNEWFEASTIEPSVLHGDLALTQTRERAAAWRGEVSQHPKQKDRGRG